MPAAQWLGVGRRHGGSGSPWVTITTPTPAKHGRNVMAARRHECHGQLLLSRSFAGKTTTSGPRRRQRHGRRCCGGHRRHKQLPQQPAVPPSGRHGKRLKPPRAATAEVSVSTGIPSASVAAVPAAASAQQPSPRGRFLSLPPTDGIKLPSIARRKGNLICNLPVIFVENRDLV